MVYSPTGPRLRLRMAIFPFVIFSLLSILLLRIWYLQVVLSPELRDQADLYGKASSSILAPRGLIYDRDGHLLAGVESEFVITAEPALIAKHPDVLGKVAALLSAQGLQVDPARLLRKARDGSSRPYDPIPIFSGAPVSVAARLSETTDGYLGIGVDTQSTRVYPDPKSFSHLLGYVWVPNAEDMERARLEHRDASSFVGKGGLEWLYERALMGVAGSEGMLLDAKRRPIRAAERIDPLPGAQLNLTIHSGLQREALRALGGYQGAVVVVEPSSGEVLCMASSPSYDLGLFKNGISQDDFAQLSSNPNHPFINRGIGSAFSPGSAFKIVTTVAAMQAGVFDPNRTYFCPGGYKLGNQFFKCLGHHGAVAFREALAKSCNTYFSDLAMRVGKDKLRQTALDMGFYSKSGVDLPYERSGLIPTDEWLKQANRSWVDGYTVLTGIGQGDVLTTPLQMADLAAMVANGGVMYRPHLVRSLGPGLEGSTEETAVREIHRINLQAQDWQMMREAMVGVIERGTAAGSRIQGLTWAGKTGSAEVFGQQKTNSWFIGFAPADNPRIAICVMVEGVGHGSDFAAPIAKRVVEAYFGGRAPY